MMNSERFGKPLASTPYPFGRMLRFILLTATRRNEAAHARRSEIDGEGLDYPGGEVQDQARPPDPLVEDGAGPDQATVAPLGQQSDFVVHP